MPSATKSETTDITDAASTPAAATKSATTAITPTSSPTPLKPLSITRRFLYSLGWTIFGLVFFYLTMVFLSTIAKQLTLERLYYLGWPRAASRHTGAVTAPVFALFLLSPPASLWSLFLSLMVCCAHFVHFVILSSDVRAFVDAEINRVMFREEATHPVWRLLPMGAVQLVGGVGMAAMLVVATERCYGPALKHRRKTLPAVSLVSCAWIWAVFNVWFVDRLVGAVMNGKDQGEILYPVPFLVSLAIGGIVAARRHCASTEKQTALATKEKVN